MFPCQQCGAYLSEDAKFCIACGARQALTPQSSSFRNNMRLIAAWQISLGFYTFFRLFVDLGHTNHGHPIQEVAPSPFGQFFRIFMLVFGICAIIIGVFLYQMKKMALASSQVVQGVSVLVFLISYWSIVSIVCVWYLSKKKTKELYNQTAQELRGKLPQAHVRK